MILTSLDHTLLETNQKPKLNPKANIKLQLQTTGKYTWFTFIKFYKTCMTV